MLSAQHPLLSGVHQDDVNRRRRSLTAICLVTLELGPVDARIAPNPAGCNANPRTPRLKGLILRFDSFPPGQTSSVLVMSIFAIYPRSLVCSISLRPASVSR